MASATSARAGRRGRGADIWGGKTVSAMLASCWRTERVTRWKEDGAGSVEELGKPEAEDGNREEDGGWVSWIRERQPVREGAGGGEEAGAGGEGEASASVSRSETSSSVDLSLKVGEGPAGGGGSHGSSGGGDGGGVAGAGGGGAATGGRVEIQVS